MDKIIISPCCNPHMSIQEALQAYSKLGYRKFEAFTTWTRSALDLTMDPSVYLELARSYQMEYYSFHLPTVTEASTSLDQSIRAASYAAALGVKVVLFKASDRRLYIEAARDFLNAISHLPIVPVLQNHAGSPISTLSDYEEVIDGIADPRMKSLLEVGHFHTVGVPWSEGWALLRDTIALIHIKDQVGSRSVPFGLGEIDLPGLFQHMRQNHYTGKYVVEMEVEDQENTLMYLKDALGFMSRHEL